MRRGCRLLACACAAVYVATSFGAKYEPQIEPSDFQAKVTNPYFPLRPGTRWKYAETVLGETFEREVTVTSETKTIMGVPCVVVHEILLAQGERREETFEWFSQDKKGNVWYFGEATTEVKPGGRLSREGSWQAGVKGALPGIIMPAEATPGRPYRHEYYAGWAEDMGQIVAVGETITVPAGAYTNCIRTKEWSLLESGGDKKWYAPGVGPVRSEGMPRELVVLVSVTLAAPR